jgi:rRNA-processing protein FCF1
MSKFRENQTTLWDIYTQDPVSKNWHINPAYQAFVDESILNLVRNKTNDIAHRMDGSLGDLDRSAIHASVIGKLFMIHHNFIISGVSDRARKRQYSYNTGMEEDGTIRSVARLIRDVFADGGLLKLKSWVKNWNDLDDVERAAVKRVIGDLGNVLTMTMIVNLFVLPWANGSKKGDDFDWMIQSFAYLCLRTEFELRSLYNPFEFFELMKNPSAAVNVIESGATILKLLSPDNYFTSSNPFRLIEKGPYEGLPRMFRNIIKTTPVKNMIEATDPRPKRQYLQTQLMWD